jgi:hypothetical protein
MTERAPAVSAWVLPLLHWLQMNEDDGYAEPGIDVWRTAQWAQSRFADRLDETVVAVVSHTMTRICPIEDSGRVGDPFLRGSDNWAVQIVDDIEGHYAELTQRGWVIGHVYIDGETRTRYWSTLGAAYDTREEAEAKILAHPEIYGPLVEPPTEERP